MLKQILLIAAFTFFVCGNSQAQEVKSIKYAIDTSSFTSEQKTIFKTFESTYEGIGAEKFKINDWGKNGFFADIIGGKMDGMMLSVRLFYADDGKCYIAFGDNVEYISENGIISRYKKMNPPIPQIVRNYSTFYEDKGLYYRGTNPYTNEQIDEWFYWNGVNFVDDGSVKHAVDTSTAMSVDAKKIYKLLDFNEKDYGYFCFNKEYFSCRKDGFSVMLEDQLKPGEDPEAHLSKMSFGISYQLYKTNSGKYLVAFYIEDEPQVDFWYYENGKLIEAKNILPKSEYNKKVSTCSYVISPNGISCNIHNQNTQQTTAENFKWNGERFMKQEM